MTIATPAQILDFWIDTATTSAEATKEKSALWFRKSDETDALLRNRFGETVEALAGGLADEWGAAGTRPRLAAIIALDQFSRNIYRGTARAFANDATALRLTMQALEEDDDADLSPVENVFLYLPIEHTEDKALQALCVAKFEAMLATAPEDFKPACEDWLDYARKHKAIIDQFDRFPHRNAILGRTSSAEELEFLAEPGSGF